MGRKAIKEGGREGASDRENVIENFSNLEFFGNLAQRSFFKNRNLYIKFVEEILRMYHAELLY